MPGGPCSDCASRVRSERELRPLVIARKVSFGSQSEAGARTREILMTTLGILVAAMRQALSRTRDFSPRPLPTDHDYDGESRDSIREYQSDQPSTSRLRPSPAPLSLTTTQEDQSLKHSGTLTGRSISVAFSLWLACLEPHLFARVW